MSSLSPSMLRAAPTQGPVSKTTVVETAASETKPVHFNLNFLPWRKASATRQSVESVVTRARPSTPPPPRPANDSSYLPTGGALPLRFASAHVWPDRMSPADEAALALALAPDPSLAILSDTALAQSTSGGSPASDVSVVPGTAPTGAAGGAVTIVASSSDAARPGQPVVVSRPAYLVSNETILTADLVLNSLGNLSNGRGAVPAQFRPAQPMDRSMESVPVAIAP